MAPCIATNQIAGKFNPELSNLFYLQGLYPLLQLYEELPLVVSIRLTVIRENSPLIELIKELLIAVLLIGILYYLMYSFQYAQ